MKYIAFDTETTGLNCYTGQDHIFAYSTCDEEGNTEVHRDDESNFREKLQSLMKDISIAKICHNLKFDLAQLQKYKIFIPEKTVWHDTMLMSQIMNNLKISHSLDNVAYELSGEDRSIDNEVAKYTTGKHKVTYDKVPREIMEKYQRFDVERTMLVFLTLFPQLKKDNDMYLDYLNEVELVKVTIDMERTGIQLVREEAVSMIHWLEDEVHDCYEKLYSLTKERINFNSPTQLNYLLYNKLKITPLKKTKTGASTDKEVLFQLRDLYHDNKLISEVLNQLSRFRSYSGAIPRIHNFLRHAEADGTIHPSIQTNEAKTGRQSVKDPPLQGVSKNKSLFNPFPVPMRKLFRARTGTVLYLPDYSGIEMRLIVNIADEPEMTEIFLSGRNAHEVAAKVFYLDKFIDKKETSTLYSSGKNAHFALPYGASPFKLGRTLGLTPSEGKQAFDRYAKRFPKIAFLSKEISKEARENGYITTSFGRKLAVPRDSLHAALNYKIQGTGAGILKRAQVRLHKFFKEKYNHEVKLVLPIHDELIMQYPRKYLPYQKDFVSEVSKHMTDFPQFKIPLESEWKMTTTTWNNAEDL